jgi:hypothetical protein
MQSERRHEAVSENLLNMSAVLMDVENEVIQQRAHPPVNDRGVDPLSEAGEAGDVGEQDGNVATM